MLQFCIDGGAAWNNPVFDENTVTVAPFAGEQDICPKDRYAHEYCFEVTGTKVEFTAENFARMFNIVFPPPTDSMWQLCERGYNDTVRYLQINSKYQKWNTLF